MKSVVVMLGARKLVSLLGVANIATTLLSALTANVNAKMLGAVPLKRSRETEETK